MDNSKGDKKRIYRQSIALTKEEYELVTTFCQKHGMSKSYFARKSIFSAIAELDNKVKKKKEGSKVDIW